MLEQFLSHADARRAQRTFEKLAGHGLSGWALTGGLATEIHCRREGRETLRRQLNDIDFIVDSFDSIPESLARDFLCRHIHPLERPGKTLAQFVDVKPALRVDVSGLLEVPSSAPCC